MKIKTFFTVSLLAVSNITFSEDIEVYVGNSNAQYDSVKPNVIFVMDTSGSMDDPVFVNGQNYDPNVDYGNTYSDNRLYYLQSKSKYISTGAFKCDSAKSTLETTGRYLGRFAQYRSSAWKTLSKSDSSSKYVECEEDSGTHGLNTGDAEVYATENGGAYSENVADSINWGNESYYYIYTGNYLNFIKWAKTQPGSTYKMRLDLVREAAINTIETTKNINLSLMRFDSKNHQGGMVDVAMGPIETVSSTIKTRLNDYEPKGGTPLSETLYEAMQYLTGGDVGYGNSSHEYQGGSIQNEGDSDLYWSNGGEHKSRNSVTDSRTTANTNKYKSPISHQCQRNSVILFSDGAPWSDNSSNDNIQNLVENLSLPQGLSKSCTGSGGCIEELAYYMANNDQSADYFGNQYINTYAIGGFFTPGSSEEVRMKNVAAAGNGKYYPATDVSTLNSALEQIFLDILNYSTTFTAPAVSINAFNKLEHRDELYFALFRPNEDPRWAGNIKRYKLSGNQILDSNDDVATDAGYFIDDAVSFWTPDTPDESPDGKFVEKGGAASLLTTNRNIYTYTSSVAANEVDITAHQIHENNTNITHSKLNIIQDDALRTNILKWARGIDIDDSDADGDVTDARRRYEDPLHSQPAVINYGGTEDNPDSTIYFGTNSGYLHAINSQTGQEVFSFVPQELLPNLEVYYQNETRSSKLYGLDGPISYWHHDINENGLLLDDTGSLETGEHIYLYFGMRRGGRNFYALDITNRNAPVLKWVIKGGEGNFKELGQTWSKMNIVNIKYQGQSKTAIIFGGGYDAAQDAYSVRTDSTVGRAIYIIDAETGQRLWSGGANPTDADDVISGMKHSVTGDVTPIDIDGDGLIDLFYASDIGGRIWRFDMNSTHDTGDSAASLVKETLIADLNGDTEATNIRFYTKPDVSIINEPGQPITFAISIGSGFRAHPLNTLSQDRFYMIKDPNVFIDAPADWQTIKHTNAGDLYDATSNVIQTGTTSEKQIAKQLLLNAKGWFLDMPNIGEKIISDSTTFAGSIIFTTFRPTQADDGVSNSCAPDVGRARTYFVNLVDGSATFPGVPDENGELQFSRFVDLEHGGIPPKPVVLFTQGDATPNGGDPADPNNPQGSDGDLCEQLSNVQVAVGTELPTNPFNQCNKSQKTYWRELR